MSSSLLPTTGQPLCWACHVSGGAMEGHSGPANVGGRERASMTARVCHGDVDVFPGWEPPALGPRASCPGRGGLTVSSPYSKAGRHSTQASWQELVEGRRGLRGELSQALWPPFPRPSLAPLINDTCHSVRADTAAGRAGDPWLH